MLEGYKQLVSGEEMSKKPRMAAADSHRQSAFLFSNPHQNAKKRDQEKIKSRFLNPVI